MSFDVIVAVEAQRNLSATFEHYREKSVRGANNWFLAYERAYRSLEQDPERFALCAENEMQAERLQQVNFGTRGSRSTHRLVFVVRDRLVHVLSLRHLHQDTWKGESSE